MGGGAPVSDCLGLSRRRMGSSGTLRLALDGLHGTVEGGCGSTPAHWQLQDHALAAEGWHLSGIPPSPPTPSNPNGQSFHSPDVLARPRRRPVAGSRQGGGLGAADVVHPGRGLQQCVLCRRLSGARGGGAGRSVQQAAGWRRGGYEEGGSQHSGEVSSMGAQRTPCLAKQGEGPHNSRAAAACAPCSPTASPAAPLTQSGRRRALLAPGAQMRGAVQPAPMPAPRAAAAAGRHGGAGRRVGSAERAAQPAAAAAAGPRHCAPVPGCHPLPW